MFPTAVAVAVNNVCNLTCAHCCLNYQSLERPLIVQELDTILTQLVAAPSVEFISIVGKEPFLGSVGPFAIRRLGELTQSSIRVIETGLITNGTLANRSILEQARLSHINVSVDGVPGDHDAIRGSGAFEAMKKNLVWMTSLESRLVTGMTLQKRNCERIIPAVQILHDLGVSVVALSFYEITPKTDPMLALSRQDIADIFLRLEDLTNIHLTHSLRVVVEVNIVNSMALVGFFHSSWCRSDEWMTRNKTLINEYQFSNGLILEFLTVPWPQTLDNIARITSDGYILRGEDSVDTTRYRERKLSNIREHRTLAGAFKFASRAIRHKEVMREWQRDILPLLRQSMVAKAATFDEEVKR